jgi:hypothetical protein
MSDEKREPKFWDCEDSEILKHTTMDEAIEAALENHDQSEPWPKTIIARGMAPMIVAVPGVLEDLLENLDEEYGGEGGDYSEATPAMEEAEKVFLAVVEREYAPWACEEVFREEINVLEWVKAHPTLCGPELLELLEARA